MYTVRIFIMYIMYVMYIASSQEQNLLVKWGCNLIDAFMDHTFFFALFNSGVIWLHLFGWWLFSRATYHLHLT